MAPSASRCGFRALPRYLRAALLRWLASVAAIDEAQDTRLHDDEIATLAAAIDAARRAGR